MRPLPEFKDLHHCHHTLSLKSLGGMGEGGCGIGDATLAQTSQGQHHACYQVIYGYNNHISGQDAIQSGNLEIPHILTSHIVCKHPNILGILFRL